MDALNQTMEICLAGPQGTSFTVLDPPQHHFRVTALILSTLTLMNYIRARGPELAMCLFRHVKEVMKGMPVTFLAIILQKQKERQWGVIY